MASKLRLNKNALREQTQQLRSYLEFLPTLRLRKQQLQAGLLRVRREQEDLRSQRRRLREQTEPWAPLLGHLVPRAAPFAEVEEVVTSVANVAGVAVPQLRALRFVARTHCVLSTPPALDDAIAVLRRVAELRAALGVLDQQEQRIAGEFRRTNQRINLYEKVRVPEAQQNIRRLRVYLGDQRTAAVCRAKLAKAKLVARAAAAGGDHGYR